MQRLDRGRAKGDAKAVSSRVVKILKDPRLLFLTAGHRGLLNWMDDETYLKIAFKIRMGERLHLDDPQTFNEKLQWLKLHDRNPLYTTMVDKHEAKQYVGGLIGEKHIIPTIGLWNSVEQIDVDQLPEQFVLKCTHDSGGLVICKDKSELNWDAVRKKLHASLKHNYYYSLREWPYKDVKPRILAEQYMQNGQDAHLAVYKIFCFSGEPTVIQTIQNDKTEYESIDYFNTSWERLDLRQNFPNSQVPVSKPQTLEKMLELAKKLSQGFPFIRTDFYEINGEVYFSEFTFYSDGGMAAFHPPKWDLELGKKIILPE